jgi:hypothetical protein
MTAEQWLTCTDPDPMLGLLRGKASDRKLRLFACACCRRIWDLLSDERSREAVEVAERYADGLTEQAEVRQALEVAPMPVWPESGPEQFNWRLVTKAIAADLTDPRTYVWLTAEVGVPELTPAVIAAKWSEHGASFVAAPCQAGLLRELFGNPFRPTTLAPAWLTADVANLAQSAYQERNLSAGTLEPVRLAVLSDALEEAGCTDAELLSHLRGPGPHVRGCWALDLILGKQ